MVGHIDGSVSLSVDIDDSVLPIDFSSDAVKYNANPGGSVGGIRFGTYTVVSNESFNLYIAHTPFELRTATEGQDGSKLEEIDYVLYVFSDTSTGTYSYCFSNEGAPNPALITQENGRILINKSARNSLAKIIQHPMFLSLVDEDKAVSTYLRAGIYESTIYFVLETE